MQVAVLLADLASPDRAKAALDKMKEQKELDEMLRHAAKQADGDISIAERLIASGASVNAADIRGWAAIHEATRAGRNDMIALLLRHGAALDMRTATITGIGGTPLWWAIETHGREHETTKYLESLQPPVHDEL